MPTGRVWGSYLKRSGSPGPGAFSWHNPFLLFSILSAQILTFKLDLFLGERSKPKVNNTETEIGDIAVRATEVLRDDHGINLTILKILKDFDASIPDGTEKFDLVEIAAAYMTLLVSE